MRCDCGQIRCVRTAKLNTGEHVSCGCLRGERMREWHKACRVEVEEGKRRCAKCKLAVPIEDFHKSNQTFSGLQTQCKRCRLALSWTKKFGISRSEGEQLLQDQGGVCAACLTVKGLHLDHDHITGRIRGFLCGNCNRALGLLKDDPNTLIRLLTYLKRKPPVIRRSRDTSRTVADRYEALHTQLSTMRRGPREAARKMLGVIRSSEGITLEELSSQLNDRSIYVTSGILASLAKTTTRAGLDFTEVVVRDGVDPHLFQPGPVLKWGLP